MTAAAEALACTAQTVEYFNGSRINDYVPFFALAEHVCALPSAALSGEGFTYLFVAFRHAMLISYVFGCHAHSL